MFFAFSGLNHEALETLRKVQEKKSKEWIRGHRCNATMIILIPCQFNETIF